MAAEEGGLLKNEESYKPLIGLPKDCVQEIITRVESSVLSSCRRVCRSWCRLAHEPAFEEIRSHRTAVAPGFILGTLHRNKLKYDFLPLYSSQFHGPHPFPISSHLLPCRPQDLTIEAAASSRGLLLYVRDANTASKVDTLNYYITRLGARDHRRIPNPSIRFRPSWSAIVCDDVGNRSGEFKIVRIYASMQRSRRAKKRACACEIFDSVSDKWRRSADIPYVNLHTNSGVVIGPTVYWMSQYTATDRGNSAFEIFAFDVEEEKGSFIYGPPMDEATISNWPWSWEMMACEGELYLVHVLDEEMEIWKMMQSAGESQGWERKGLVNFQRLKDHVFAFEDGVLDDEVVLLETLYRKFWYELEGMKYINHMNPPLYTWRVDMTVADFQSFIKI